MAASITYSTQLCPLSYILVKILASNCCCEAVFSALTYFLTVLLETEQLTIAVTKYDRFFESSDDESSDADSDSDEINTSSHEVETYDVKRRICQQLQDTLKLTSPVCHDLVNLVSGKWALKARKSKRNEENLSKHHERLKSYSSKASLSNEAASHGAAERLLLASGIEQLEKRWNCMGSRSQSVLSYYCLLWPPQVWKDCIQ